MVSKQVSTPELSTTILAKQLKLDTKEMFRQLVEVGLIMRSGENWELTQAGKSNRVLKNGC